jgi:outer membrane protein
MMQRMSLLVLLAVMMGLYDVQAQAALPLSVSDAIARSRANNPTALAARQDVQAMKGAHVSSLAGFLPSLRVSETLMRTNDPVAVFGTKLRQTRFAQTDLALNALNHPNAVNNAATALMFRQPVFSGGSALAQRRAAASQVAAGAGQEARHLQMLALETRKAYYGVVLAKSQLTVIRSALAAAESHVQQAMVMREAGTVAQSDVLSARVRESQLRENAITAQHAVANAEDGLLLVMGMPMEPKPDLLLVDSLRQEDVQPSLETLLSGLEARRPDLTAQQAMTDAVGHQVSVAKGSRLPQANIMAQYEMSADKVMGKDGDHWGAFVEVSWDLFTGMHRVGQVRQAKAQHAAMEHRSAYALNQAKVEVRVAYRNMLAAKERIGVAEESVTAAEESLRMVELQYDAGLATVTRLLETEAALTETRGRLLLALHDYTMGIAQLEFAAALNITGR